MSEYNCFWWDCCVCDAGGTCSECKYRIAPNTTPEVYYELAEEYQDRVNNALEPLWQEYKNYFKFYTKGVISQ